MKRLIVLTFIFVVLVRPNTLITKSVKTTVKLSFPADVMTKPDIHSTVIAHIDDGISITVDGIHDDNLMWMYTPSIKGWILSTATEHFMCIPPDRVQT